MQPIFTRNKPKTKEQFIEDAVKIHGPKYDYSLVDYVRAVDKVVIKCRWHGTFRQSPNAHLSQKSGCPTCGKVKQVDSWYDQWTHKRWAKIFYDKN